MAVFISFANQKGGVGKSQCTLMSAAALAQSKAQKVLVVDIDKQKSIHSLRDLDIKAYGENFPKVYFSVISLTSQQFIERLDEFDDAYDVVFIDIAGKMDNNLPVNQQEVTPVLMVCDIVLVPFLGGNHTIGSTSEFIHFAMQVKEMRDKDAHLSQRPLSIGVFGNRISKDAVSADALNEMWSLKHLYPTLEILKTHLKDSNIFKTCDTVTSLYNKSKQSARVNFTAWLDEILAKFEII